MFRPFFFSERTVAGILYLDTNMLEEVFVPILEEEGPDDRLFRKDVLPSHFHKEMTDFINSLVSRAANYSG
jgi:hypothetical protein